MGFARVHELVLCQSFRSIKTESQVGLLNFTLSFVMGAPSYGMHMVLFHHPSLTSTSLTSAGTLSPIERHTMSPGTSSRARRCCSLPSLMLVSPHKEINTKKWHRISKAELPKGLWGRCILVTRDVRPLQWQWKRKQKLLPFVCLSVVRNGNQSSKLLLSSQATCN